MTNAHTPIELVWVAVGHPDDPNQLLIPITIHDTQSRRIRYTYAHRDQLAVMLGRSLGKWTALWIQTTPADRGEWRLLDLVNDETREVA